MARLLLVELRRALSRGVTKVLTALGVLAVVAIGVLVFIANKDLDTLRAEARADHDRLVAQCTADPARQGFVMPSGPGGRPVPGGPMTVPSPPPAGSPEARALCEQLYASVLTYRETQVFELTMLRPGPPDVGRAGPPDPMIADIPALFSGAVMMPAFMLLVGAVVAGASMVGAEWQAGSLVTLLTWEPRRGRLLAARMIVAAVIGTVIGVALLALFTGALAVTAAAKGVMPTGTDWWVTYAGVVLRLGAFTGLAAVVGVALATIGRRTALAVLAVPLYLVGVEIVIRQYWAAARPWLLLRNLALALGGEAYLPDAGSAWRGAAVLVAWSAVVVVLALVAFRRRDFASSN